MSRIIDQSGHKRYQKNRKGLGHKLTSGSFQKPCYTWTAGGPKFVHYIHVLYTEWFTGWTPNLWTVLFDTPNSWWMIKIKIFYIQKQILFILNDSRPLLLLKMTIFIQIIIFENIKYTWFFKKSEIYFFNDDKVKCLAIQSGWECHIWLYTTNMEPFQWFERLFLVLPIFF